MRRFAQILLLFVGVLPAAVSLAASISIDALRNAAYPSGFAPEGVIRLHGGEFQERIERRGEVRVILTDHVAIGTLPDGTDVAAVVLRTTTGGNAIFHELTLMVEDERGLRWRATTPLGDRVIIDDVALRGREVVLSLREHAAEDPMCCPSRRTEARFAIRGSRLVAKSADD